MKEIMRKQKFAITRHSTSQSCVADGKPLPEIAHRLNEATGVIQQYWESPGPSRELLTSFLGSCRDGLSIGTKFVFDLGMNIHLGRNVTIGDNVTILDCGDVFIGDNVHHRQGNRHLISALEVIPLFSPHAKTQRVFSPSFFTLRDALQLCF